VLTHLVGGAGNKVGNAVPAIDKFHPGPIEDLSLTFGHVNELADE
jgi:hypothetical protein